MTDLNALLDWEGGVPEAQPPEGTSTAWMLTFADLVSLMLTFFVLLFAVSGVKVDRWQEVVDTLSRSLNPALDAAKSGSALKNIEQVEVRRATSLSYLASLFEALTADTPQLKGTSVRLLDDRLVLSLPASALFAQGGTALTAAARPVMGSIGEVLNGLTNQIAVAAYAAPAAETEATYRSGWEFSLARAGAVANFLKSVGVTQPIRIYGMGEAAHAPPSLDIVILPSWRQQP